MILNAVITFVFLIVYYSIAKNKFSYWRIKLDFTKKTFWELFNFSGFIFISKLSQFFSNYILKFVIGIFISPAAVTYFAVPEKLSINAFGGVLSNGSNVLFPYISDLFAKKDSTKNIKSLLKTNKTFAVFSIPIFLFIIFFSRPILDVWMGENFASSSWIILKLSWHCIAYRFTNHHLNTFYTWNGNGKNTQLFFTF